MIFVLFLILNFSVLFGWFLIIRSKKWLNALADQFIGANILTLTQIILVILFFGYFLKTLTLIYLVSVNLFILGVQFFYLKISRSSIKGLLFDIFKINSKIFLDRPLNLILFTFVIFETAWLLFLAWLFPMLEIDTFLYHLSSVAFYFQENKIYEVVAPLQIKFWVNGYPKYIEFLSLWQMLWTKNDIFVDTIQLYFGILGIFAVYNLATKLGIKKGLALCAGLLFFLTPTLLVQAKTGYIDVSVAVLILITLNFLINTLKNKYCIVFAGISAGLLLGSKFSGWGFLIIFLIFLFALNYFYKRKIKENPWRFYLAQSLILVLIALMVGGFWYFKNVYYYKNPFWPYKINFLGKEVFKGEITERLINIPNTPLEYRNKPLWSNIFRSWREETEIYNYDSRKGGLGAVWFIVGLPLLFFAILKSLTEKNWLVLSLIGMIGLTLAIQPLPWWPRYTLFIVGIGSVIIFWVYKQQRKFIKIFLEIVLILLVLHNILVTLDHGYYSPNNIRNFLKKPLDRRTPAEFGWKEYIGPTYEYIDTHTRKKRGKIVYSEGIIYLYPLWGYDLRNKLYYFNPDNFQEWEQNIKTNKIDYIFVSKNSREAQFARRIKDYSMVMEDKDYEVYKSKEIE